MDIGAYTLRTWGADQTLRYIDDLERVAGGWLTTRRPAAPAITFGPAYAAWNKASTSCFSGGRRAAFSFRVSFISGCCRKDTPSMKTKRDISRPDCGLKSISTI